MKVLLINNFFYRKGGSEAVFFNTADILRKAGHEVVFFSYEDEQNIHVGDHEYFIKHSGTLGRVQDFFSNPDAARKMDDILIKEKPDIAHAHLFWGGISPSIFAVLKKYGVPLVHTAHDYRMVCPAYLLTDGKRQFCDRCKGGKFYNCTLHRCSKGSIFESTLMTFEMYYRNMKWHPSKMIDGIIFVSNFSKQKHIAFDKRFADARTMVLYNCPGEQVKDSFDSSLNTYDSYYMYYGRLSEEKGVPTLIRAFEHYPQLQLKVIGTGPIEDKLKEFCRLNHIINVEFLGYKFGKELFDYVARAKYVCVPSECYENNPMTIVEAYSLRTPVVGAAIGGISEVVNDSITGFAFDSGNVESLVKALGLSKGLSVNEYEHLKNNALAFAKEKFSREKYLNNLITLYKSLIKQQ